MNSLVELQNRLYITDLKIKLLENMLSPSKGIGPVKIRSMTHILNMNKLHTLQSRVVHIGKNKRSEFVSFGIASITNQIQPIT